DLGDRGGGDRGRRHGVRDAQHVQPEHRVRPDLPAAGDRHPGRHGQHRRRARGVRARDHARVAGGRVLEPRMVDGGVLRGSRAGARVPAAGPVRAPGGEGAMRAAGLWRAAGLAVLLAVAVVIPLAKNVTVTHVGVFVLLYVGAAVAWNIFSGFTGYISLGAAVFFGTGVYTVALLSKHLDLVGGIVFALFP